MDPNSGRIYEVIDDAPADVRARLIQVPPRSRAEVREALAETGTGHIDLKSKLAQGIIASHKRLEARRKAAKQARKARARNRK